MSNILIRHDAGMHQMLRNTTEGADLVRKKQKHSLEQVIIVAQSRKVLMGMNQAEQRADLAGSRSNMSKGRKMWAPLALLWTPGQYGQLVLKEQQQRQRREVRQGVSYLGSPSSKPECRREKERALRTVLFTLHCPEFSCKK